MKKTAILTIICIVTGLCLVACGDKKSDKKENATTTKAEATTDTAETEMLVEADSTTDVEEKESTTEEDAATQEETTTVKQEETTTEKEETTTTKQEVTTTKKQETATTKKQETTTSKKEEATTKEEETTTQAPVVEQSWFDKNGFSFSEFCDEFTYCDSTEEGHICQWLTLSKKILDDGSIQYFYGATYPYTACGGCYLIFAVDKYTGICIDYSAEYTDDDYVHDDVTFESNGKSVTVKYDTYGVPRYINYPADYDGIILMAVFFDTWDEATNGIYSGELTSIEEYVDISTAKMLFFEID